LNIAVVTTLSSLVSGALAFEIDSGNPDVAIRLDNTIRLNYAQRVQQRDAKIGNTLVADEGTYSFNRGQAVAERLDLLSEFDVVYKKRSGLRISATAWADGAYGDHSRSNPALSGLSSYVNHEYSPMIKRLYGGPSGELMDAFVFGGTEIGDASVDAKLGRHTVYWGESLFLGGNLHSVAYGQSPLDLQKGFATPGVEAKELFRPVGQLSLKTQLNEELSLAAQYMYDWQPSRFPEGGTYLGPVDFVFHGPDRQYVSPALGFAYRGATSAPKRGDYGLSARWSPNWLDGTVGFYYRNFSDKIPQVLLTSAGVNNSSIYTPIYAKNIQMLGMSLTKNIAGVSVGAELSYRRNTPLNSKTLGIVSGVPKPGDTNGPRGDTMHALVNAVGVINRTPLFDTASWAAEVTWAKWNNVRSGADNFQAMGFLPCVGKDKWDGCVTKDYVGVAIGFTPTWFQVAPGVDISAPVSYSVGVHGNSPTTFGGNQGLGNFTIGLGVDIQQKYRFDLKYVGFLGRYRDNGNSVTSTNGFATYLVDRGFVSLTFKTTF
jgi:hypothetical protein